MKKILIISILFLNGCLLDFDTDVQKASPCLDDLAHSDTCYYAIDDNKNVFLRERDYEKYGIVKNFIPKNFKIGSKDGQFVCTSVRGNDNDNCGACGFVCDEKSECSEGICRCPQMCRQGSECNARGTCVCRNGDAEIPEEELTTNENCGYCGNKCIGSTRCQKNPNSGKYSCLCSNGKSTCLGYGECAIDINGDKEHCGFCENRCLPEGVEKLDNVVTEKIACVDALCQYPCEENYANCDDDKVNGCEISLNNTVEHCGACANNCDDNVKNANGIKCEAGKCDYGDCKTNFLDLDNNRTNGCEIDASVDSEHCGNDNINCNKAVSHATGKKCLDGKCDYDNCDNNFLDLDGNRANGCEVNTQTNVNHCGGKSKVCNNSNVLNASGIQCTGGKCDYDNCDNNFLDLDGKRENGCEVNTQTNVNHCGGQNNVCNSENVSNANGIKCTGGKCNYASCNANFLDLDGKRENGCEVDTRTDVNHCGGKNKVCNESNVLNAFRIKCTDGKCDYRHCNRDYLDLDNNRSNGCETSNKTKACGKIGEILVNCNIAVKNATGIECRSGICDYFMCRHHYDDADGIRSNGCEYKE